MPWRGGSGAHGSAWLVDGGSVTEHSVAYRTISEQSTKRFEN